jgi:hypothetical protein
MTIVQGTHPMQLDPALPLATRAPPLAEPERPSDDH